MIRLRRHLPVLSQAVLLLVLLWATFCAQAARVVEIPVFRGPTGLPAPTKVQFTLVDGSGAPLLGLLTEAGEPISGSHEVTSGTVLTTVTVTAQDEIAPASWWQVDVTGAVNKRYTVQIPTAAEPLAWIDLIQLAGELSAEDLSALSWPLSGDVTRRIQIPVFRGPTGVPAPTKVKFTLVGKTGSPVLGFVVPTETPVLGAYEVTSGAADQEVTLPISTAIYPFSWWQIDVTGAVNARYKVQIAASAGLLLWADLIQAGAPLSPAELSALTRHIDDVAVQKHLPSMDGVPDGQILTTEGEAAVWAPGVVSETDPLFRASPAAGIGAQDITDWGAAYGWGDHGLMGYLLPGVDAALLGSGTATAGYAPLADGAGGIAWGAALADESDPVALAALGDHAAAADPHPGYALESALGVLAYEATVQGSPSGETDPDLFASTDDAGDIEMIDAAGARTRLELGTAATTDASAYEPAGVTASEVANTPAGRVAATNVQAAIDELDTEKLTTAEISTAMSWQYGFHTTPVVLATAGWKGYVVHPYGIAVTSVACGVSVAPTGGYIQVDLLENGTSILSTKIKVDAGTYTSLASATPPVISDSALAYGSLLTMTIDAVGATEPGKGLQCWIIGLMP